MTQQSPMEAARPSAMRSRPVRLERVFDDPEAVVDEIKSRAPYPTMSAHHGLGSFAPMLPWFRTEFTDAPFLHVERFTEAAKTAFSAQIVEPVRVVLNLNTATSVGATHVDLPAFRGFTAPRVPVWLLMNMSYSGLFEDWRVPFASGLVWFHRGQGGEFEYWPDGPDSASKLEGPPMWNVGLMSDNEFMWHRVRPIGAGEDQARFQSLVGYDHAIHWHDGHREIRDGDRIVTQEEPDGLRISLLWKARVFTDEAHRASFRRLELDLGVERVVDLYLDDLAARGVRAPRPEDPFTDANWQALLGEAYPPAVDPG
jgi:hypothetical protein